MKSLKGSLLIASPTMLDSFFSKTVILMFEHNLDGAAGVVINRPTEATVTDIAETVLGAPFEWPKALSLGGPVPGPLTILHDVEDLADQAILPGLFSSIELAKVRELIEGRVEPSIVVANYAGWGPMQLEGEFDGDSWLALPATAEDVFWAGERDLWEVVVHRHNARKLSDFLGLRDLPADPSLN